MKTTGKVLALACGLLLGLVGVPAGATVVYQWHTIASSGDLVPLSGTLVVTDAAWNTGALDYHFEQSAPPLDHDPTSPIIAAEFTVDGSGTGWGGPLSVTIHPVTGQTGGPGPWTLDADLGFASSGFLTGSLYANDQQSDYRMASNAAGSIWTIDAFNTDTELGSCHTTGVCSGATGFWKLESDVVAVPEPNGLWLFALGLLALGFGLRYMRKAPR